ncbi:MAG: hypothetical protein MZU79_08700 [Anaerotruncus sp.]|nr:hypothetical protein [Anaerotruncus sp.]
MAWSEWNTRWVNDSGLSIFVSLSNLSRNLECGTRPLGDVYRNVEVGCIHDIGKGFDNAGAQLIEGVDLVDRPCDHRKGGVHPERPVLLRDSPCSGEHC